MTYKINGTTLLLQPTIGKWGPRRALGVDGNNRAIYSPVYMFGLGWDAMTFAQFKQLYDFWNVVAATGTVTVDLPPKGQISYDTFVTYTGCIIDEPVSRELFQRHLLKVELTVRNITV